MAITKCCGCCSLQTGTLIIGFLHFIFGAALTILHSINLSASLNRLDHGVEVAEIIPSVTFLFYSIIHLIFSGLLIIGILRRIANYVFVFTCINFASILINFGQLISVLTLYILLSMPIITILISLISYIIGISIGIYCWFVVYYFYQELIADQHRKIFQANPGNYPYPVAPGMIYNS